jgi:hypothetical protein
MVGLIEDLREVFTELGEAVWEVWPFRLVPVTLAWLNRILRRG